MENLEEFLKQSKMAARVVLPTHVVVGRDRLSSEALAALSTRGTYAGGDSACDLEVGGQVVARGRVVTRRGKRYFQVREIAGGPS